MCRLSHMSAFDNISGDEHRWKSNTGFLYENNTRQTFLNWQAEAKQEERERENRMSVIPNN